MQLANSNSGVVVIMHIVKHRDSESASVHNSFAYDVDKFFFVAIYKTKYS